MARQKIISDPLLNSRMRRHLKNLGLSSVSEYRRWCGSHGFRTELSKNLHQLDDETRAIRNDEKSKLSSAGLSDHIEALGLGDIDEYRSWCRSTGISESLNKSHAQRKKEIEKNDFEVSDRNFVGTQDNLIRVIKSICRSEVSRDRITNPALARFCELVGNCENDARV